MAELHIVGQILGAANFSLPSIFCKFSVEAGANFRLLQGSVSGQTQCDMPPEGEMALLAHPLDVHYALKGIDGWPRLRLEVYGVDEYGRVELAGYGCALVPTSPGTHELRCATWRPTGSLREQLSSARSPRAAAHACPPHACPPRTPARRAAWPRALACSLGGSSATRAPLHSQPSFSAVGRGSSTRR